MPEFTRYVAIGDSQTEGLWDGDDSAGLTGFADRLAAMVDTHHPGLLYANLAVRGRRIADLIDEQLTPALQMRPDLITVCIGMNDVTRPGRHFGRALDDLDTVYARLADSGATVVTTTFPDVSAILPVGRVIVSRVHRINDRIRAAADRHGFRLVDLYSAPSMRHHDTWSPDRIHGSTKGHILFAEAAAEALGLPGSSHDWAEAGTVVEPSSGERGYAQLQWTKNMLLPWLWRQVRGKSEGDGRGPRRPRLAPVG